MKWFKFDKNKGSRQKRPPIKKWVLVMVNDVLGVNGVVVGYRKDGAGDKQSPYFVTPGILCNPIAWCDCLPDNYEYVGEEALL